MGVEVKETFHENGNLAYRTYSLDGVLHNDCGPSVEAYHKSGMPLAFFHTRQGVAHNDTGPATLMWEDGPTPFARPTLEEWHRDGKLHREDGPACRRWDKDGRLFAIERYLNGERHDIPDTLATQWAENGEWEESKASAALASSIQAKPTFQGEAVKTGARAVYEAAQAKPEAGKEKPQGRAEAR